MAWSNDREQRFDRPDMCLSCAACVAVTVLSTMQTRTGLSRAVYCFISARWYGRGEVAAVPSNGVILLSSAQMLPMPVAASSEVALAAFSRNVDYSHVDEMLTIIFASCTCLRSLAFIEASQREPSASAVRTVAASSYPQCPLKHSYHTA